MEKLLLVLFLALQNLNPSHTFILPLKKTNGSLDVEHLVGHMTFFEQTIVSFQQTIKNQDADIAMLKNEIYNLKASKQIIANSHDEIVAVKTEISNLKENQQKRDKRIFDLQTQVQPGPTSAEVTSLQAEVHSAKTELTLVSNEVISLASKFTNLTQDFQSLSSLVNCTDTDQNITKDVQIIQDILGRAVSHIHSAESDRFLLHKTVNELNKTILQLRNNSSVTQTALLAEIAKLNTEVRFDTWVGPSEVALQTNIHSTLKFSDIKYNIGNGYNATTGVFTAPVSGTYLFWTHVEKLSGPYLELFFKKGNSDIGYYGTTADGHLTGSLITAVPVKAGEQLRVVTAGADNLKCCVYSRFGGIMLNMQ